MTPEQSKAIYHSNLEESRIYLDKSQVAYWISEVVSWLFCTRKEFLDFEYFREKEAELREILEAMVRAEAEEIDQAETTSAAFSKALPGIHRSLSEDLEVILQFDPAAGSKNEILLAYPGFFATAVYRIAHVLCKNQVPTLARLVSEIAHSRTGIDIHPAATIGSRFFIDHGTGIVIGETTLIGNDVKVYQGVTLGALSVSKDKAKKKRHPTIEDGVIIYANATILGGNTVVGKGAVIGGNVWLTNSVPAQSLVFHKSEIDIKSRKVFPEAINFSI